MADDAPALTRDDVRKEAREILLAIDGNRHDQVRHQSSWRKLWQLAREARAAFLPLDDLAGPWSIDINGGALSPTLIGDNFMVPIWPPEEARSHIDLPKLLNWAGVPVPMDERSFSDRSDSVERAREAAERRREQAELHRRQSEEGRDIAETIRTRHEAFRDQEETDRVDSEHLRDAQEGSRELAEHAREIAETLRQMAAEARSAVDDARQALTELKELAQRQREVLERQEKALAAFENRTRAPER